ncbi:MAG TPA: hypothetical protein VFB72_16185 [Verrucomicrobiae bacterium]|nr:hypothetical protein [Verrucomicrobiae bacterium]
MGAKKPPAAFYVLAGSLFASFSCAGFIAAFLLTKLLPYVAFGPEAVHGEKIRIVKNVRGLIEFSNGVQWKGIKLLPVDLVYGMVVGLLGLALMLTLLKVAVLVLRKYKPSVANDLQTWLSNVAESLSAVIRSR